jgi:hypothetical protein
MGVGSKQSALIAEGKKDTLQVQCLLCFIFRQISVTGVVYLVMFEEFHILILE